MRMVTDTRKPLQFMGASHNDLRAFPDEARRDAGFNLDFVQRGLDPENWKPMKTVGVGVNEIRVRDATGGLSRDLFCNPAGSGLRAALHSEENGKDESTRYRFGQETIQGYTEASEEVSDEEEAHSR